MKITTRPMTPAKPVTHIARMRPSEYSSDSRSARTMMVTFFLSWRYQQSLSLFKSFSYSFLRFSASPVRKQSVCLSLSYAFWSLSFFSSSKTLRSKTRLESGLQSLGLPSTTSVLVIVHLYSSHRRSRSLYERCSVVSFSQKLNTY